MTPADTGSGATVVRGGHVVTLDSPGELDGDVLIRNGQIEAVAPAIAAVGADVIAAEGMVVMPGFVETHWHLWNSLLRGLVGETPDTGYFPVKNRYAPHFRPEDTYAATYLAANEAIEAGITTIHNWHHNVRSTADAEASLQAMSDAGIRGRFSYGTPDRHPPEVLMDLVGLEAVVGGWRSHPAPRRLSFGVALRGPIRTTREVNEHEWAFARAAELPITVHCGGRRGEPGRYCDLPQWAKQGLLGPDVQVVHAVDATEDEIRLLASTGTHVSLSPTTELLDGGMPPVTQLLAHGVLTSLSIDTTAFPTRADLFLQMRVIYSVERSLHRASEPPSARRLLQMATLDGARDLGLDREVGSIAPGKRADLVLLRLDDLNLVPGTDPSRLAVLAAGPWNVDTVIVDGEVLKRSGRLVRADATDVARQARLAAQRVIARGDA